MPRILGKRQGKLRDQNYDCRPTSVCCVCRAHAADGTRLADSCHAQGAACAICRSVFLCEERSAAGCNSCMELSSSVGGTCQTGC